MGKCVSKHPSVVNLTESDFTTKGIKRKFSEISDCTPICEEDEEYCNSVTEDKNRKNAGQSESKKNSKKAGAPETKGTAMSFGFRKKIQSANKKNANIFKDKGKEKEKAVDLIKYQDKLDQKHVTTVISNQEAIVTSADAQANDSNGNEGTESTSDKQDGKRNAAPSIKRDAGSGLPAYKGSRFGFRASNIVRPASAGLTPKVTDFEENIENNNVTEKRRSKSATGTQRLQTAPTTRYQINDQHHVSEVISKNAIPKIGPATTTASTTFNNRSQWFLQQERRNNMSEFQQSGFGKPPTSGQYTVINTGMHTNVIVKPMPQPAVASVSRFTLHTTSLPKPQYPVPISLPSSRSAMDSKNVKQVVNNTRKGFTGPREISTDSGIASLDATFEYSTAGGGQSPSRHSRARSRPRNLEMVFNSRHKFDVRDLDDTLSCDSVEPLALPKLPSVFSSDNQTVPLNGLVRSSFNMSQEEAEDQMNCRKTSRSQSDAENNEEEKLYRDRSTSEKTAKNPSIKDYNISSKNSSPVSSRSSWCNAGESLAPNDCSSFSLSSSDESKDNQNEKASFKVFEDISSIATTDKPSQLSSLSTETPKANEKNNQRTTMERPGTLSNIAETKFAEMAAAVSDILLDDETSPTDSLVSSTESEEMMLKKEKAKKKLIEDAREKDIDEISPEIDLVSSPRSPGTPTHASNSLSLSDAGRDFLIDDEIADQPALLFSDKADLADANQMRHSLTDTPTLMESNSIKSSAQISKPKLPSLINLENSNRTPKIKRRSTLLSKAESLDTLSPCESIASDDLMMDFETSSLDSIDRLSHSIKSQSGSALNGIDDLQLFSELDVKSGELIREWNNVLRIHRTGNDSISSLLPARATRLLNRSRLQQSQLSNTGSDSPRSIDSLPHKHSRSSLSGKDTAVSSDDLLFADKSFRNSMIQDVQYFKKQLIRLRRVLQDTETLNPFEQSNGKLFASCELDSSQVTADEKDLSSLASSIADDPRQELADLRRQGQLDDRDRTIRIQKNLIEKLESERSTTSVATSISEKECINTATQTDRVRPLSIGQEGLARSKPELTSYTTHFPANNNATQPDKAGRRHTVISTTLTNLNHIASACPTRRASLSLEKLTYKPVKTTMIGEPVKETALEASATSKSSSNEASPVKSLRNGLNGIALNGFKSQNGCSVQQKQQPLTNGAQQSMQICHKTKEIRFDDLKQEHRTQTITIV
ncbi:uncharacterized protein LOC119650260 isoform X4 [Hermetia illucens]|uniref:uncharacterized protein LOC119650260 isoform X4 n=1 Tax=Hermetia illucens TaxID=343691 RepID=UPI0018CC603A|nr:uncharacterized protein LOC119650260 isoform X4 [Hermetia illucens]